MQVSFLGTILTKVVLAAGNCIVTNGINGIFMTISNCNCINEHKPVICGGHSATAIKIFKDGTQMPLEKKTP